jgi:hypothetical protein
MINDVSPKPVWLTPTGFFRSVHRRPNRHRGCFGIDEPLRKPPISNRHSAIGNRHSAFGIPKSKIQNPKFQPGNLRQVCDLNGLWAERRLADC